MKTQTELAKKWGVSRSLVCKYHKAGMPLHEAKAESWLNQNVASKIPLNIEARRSAPSPDPRQGDPNWRFTRSETLEVIEILRDMKAEGATRKSHPRHQAFCDGIRLLFDRGISL